MYVAVRRCPSPSCLWPSNLALLLRLLLVLLVQNTSFPEKLNLKYFIVECWDHRTFGSDMFVGQAKVDLFTAACGPELHELTLINEKKEAAGKVLFDLEMPQQLKEFTFTFSDVVLSGRFPAAYDRFTEGVASIQLEYSFSEEYGHAHTHTHTAHARIPSCHSTTRSCQVFGPLRGGVFVCITTVSSCFVLPLCSFFALATGPTKL
jgi:hypothetical protein